MIVATHQLNDNNYAINYGYFTEKNMLKYEIPVKSASFTAI